MPWYPGTDGRTVTSYWDGQRRRISLTRDHLLLDADCVALADIASVAYWNKSIYVLPGVHPGPRWPYIDRGFSVIGIDGSKHTIDFSNPMNRNLPENEAAWRGLVDISRRFIEPRIAQRILGELRTGGEYSIRGRWFFVTLNSHGFTGRLLRTRTYPWSEFGQIFADPYSNNMSMKMTGNDGKVWVYARPASKAKLRTLTMLNTDLPNAVVLDSLMPMAATEFGHLGP